MTHDLDALRVLAGRAARVGGRTILEQAWKSDPQTKGAGDYVTGTDRASEAAIAGLLSAHTPEIAIVGEEEGGPAADRYWLVDPLDGTTNFVQGLPMVGVSVALIENGLPVVGAVHAPFLGDTYMGVRGRGAWMERADGRIDALSVGELPVDRAIVGTGFPFRRKERLPRYLRFMARALERFEDLRRPGAASLDLAWVAAGVFDGFFELGLAPWDVAAGALLIEGAGGVVTDWDGGAAYLVGDILAGPRHVHAELVRIAAAE